MKGRWTASLLSPSCPASPPPRSGAAPNGTQLEQRGLSCRCARSPWRFTALPVAAALEAHPSASLPSPAAPPIHASVFVLPCEQPTASTDCTPRHSDEEWRRSPPPERSWRLRDASSKRLWKCLTVPFVCGGGIESGSGRCRARRRTDRGRGFHLRRWPGRRTRACFANLLDWMAAVATMMAGRRVDLWQLAHRTERSGCLVARWGLHATAHSPRLPRKVRSRQRPLMCLGNLPSQWSLVSGPERVGVKARRAS